MYTVEIVKNKFWIIEDSGVKIGTIRKSTSVDFEVIMRDTMSIEILTLDSLITKYGSSILESKQVKKIEAVDYGKDIDDVNGYPTKHRAYNKSIDKNGIPVYTKTENSKITYAAGYYGISFPGAGWKNAYCVKRDTLDAYKFIGPFKNKTHLEAEINRCTKR